MAATTIALPTLTPNYVGGVLSGNVTIPLDCWDKITLTIVFDVVHNSLADGTLCYYVETIPGRMKDPSVFDHGVGCFFDTLDFFSTGTGRTMTIDLSNLFANNINQSTQDGWFMGDLVLRAGTTFPLYFEFGSQGLNPPNDLPDVNHSTITITACSMTLYPKTDIPLPAYDGTFPKIVNAKAIDSAIVATWEDCGVHRFATHLGPLGNVGHGADHWEPIQSRIGRDSLLAHALNTGYQPEQWRGSQMFYRNPATGVLDPASKQFQTPPFVGYDMVGNAVLYITDTSFPFNPLLNGFGVGEGAWRGIGVAGTPSPFFLGAGITTRQTIWGCATCTNWAGFSIGEVAFSGFWNFAVSTGFIPTNPFPPSVFMNRNMLGAFDDPLDATISTYGPFCGAVSLPNAFGLLYNRDPGRGVYWKKRIFGVPNPFDLSIPDTAGHRHGTVTGSPDDPYSTGTLIGAFGSLSPVGLVYTSARILVGLLWDWDGYGGSKALTPCWSHDEGATWTLGSAIAGAFPAPPCLVCIQHHVLGVYLDSDFAPNFIASSDGGKTWV